MGKRSRDAGKPSAATLRKVLAEEASARELEELGLHWLAREEAEPGALAAELAALAPARAAAAGDCETVRGVLQDRWGIPSSDIASPATLQELVAVVEQARAARRRLRVVGSARSLSDASRPDPGALVVSTCRLDRLLDAQPARLPAAQGLSLVRLQCGTNVRSAVDALHARGLALPNLGSGSFQTVVGACSTCTHGSGASLPPLPGLVRAIEIVEIHAGAVRVRRLEDPARRITDPARWPGTIDGVPAALVQDDADAFGAAVVGLGCLGVVYAVTLEVVPEFWLSETRTIEPWSDVRTRLQTEATQIRHYELLVSPYLESGAREVLVTRRVLSPTQRREGGRPPAMALARTALGRSVAGAALKDAVLQPLTDAPNNVRRALRCTTVDRYVDRSADVLWLNLDLNSTAAEFAVPLDRAVEAAELVLGLVERNRAAAEALWAGPGSRTEKAIAVWRRAPLPTSPIALRFCDRFDGLVAMTTGHRTCLIELPFPGSDRLDRRHAEGKDQAEDRVYSAYLAGRTAFLREVDRVLAPLGARPHWGLVNFLDQDAAARCYGAGWARWVARYLVADRDGVFAGPISDQLGLSRPLVAAVGAPEAKRAAAPAAVKPSVLPDSPDLRDRWYEPALVALPRSASSPGTAAVRDQRLDPACTGFALAAVIRVAAPTQPEVSARMLYAMARRHDEFPGEADQGSSLRGALKGFFQHGACTLEAWPDDDGDGALTLDRARSARATALGAYYRLRPVLHEWHAALVEAGAVYVSAWTHDGWERPADGAVPYAAGAERGALHAFAVVGYDADRGFRVQNSWGPTWGDGGFAWWSYEDWVDNVQDAWVFRLAVPTPQVFERLRLRAGARAPAAAAGTRRAEIAGHFVHFDDGRLVTTGKYWSTLADLRQTASWLAGSDRYRDVVLYAHGGMTGPESAAGRAAALRDGFKRNGVYPIHALWETGFAEEVGDLLRRGHQTAEARAGSVTEWTDRFLERATGRVGRLLWSEMQQDAERIFAEGGDGRGVAEVLAPALAGRRLHLVGHSAGSILIGRLLQAVPSLRVETVSLLAPACTVALFESALRPLLGDRIRRLRLYVLSDARERDDSAGPYRKSILYYVSNVAEPRPDDVRGPVPILGMEAAALALAPHPALEVVVARDGEWRSTARTHVGFDSDAPTLDDVLARILGRAPERPFTADEVR